MRFLSLLFAACLLLPFCTARAEEDYTVSYEGIKAGVVNARVGVHDPSIIAADGSYYIFGSHMASAKSDNLRTHVSVPIKATDRLRLNAVRRCPREARKTVSA